MNAKENKDENVCSYIDVQNDLWTIIVLDSRLPAALKSCEVCQPTTFSITTTIFL